MTFSVCDPGRYVHNPDVQNKRDDNTHTQTRMTGPDCAVMRNLINTHTDTHESGVGTETVTGTGTERERERGWK